jgi:hypothetical protein
LRKTHHKNRAAGVAQGEGPEFKPQLPPHPKKEEKKKKVEEKENSLGIS